MDDTFFAMLNECQDCNLLLCYGSHANGLTSNSSLVLFLMSNGITLCATENFNNLWPRLPSIK